jgi:hypothetical protein
MNPNSPTARFAVRFIGVCALAGISLATLGHAQQSPEKKRLAIVCYWQNYSENVLNHFPQYVPKDGCEKYQDPMHCRRTAVEMTSDTKHDWERVTANGLIYTISCRHNCKEIPMEGQNFDAETDGQQMWITFEKPGKKDIVGTFEVVDISPMREDRPAETQSGESAERPQQPSPPQNSQPSSSDYETLAKLLVLDPPEFCTATSLLNKTFVATMGTWQSAFEGTLAEKIQYDSVFATLEDKLWKCSHLAVMGNDEDSLRQDLLALVLVEQAHLALRQSALDNAVDSMVVLSSVAPAPQPSVGQRIQAGIQGAANGLSQWAEYQRQLRLARVQNQLHCTTTTYHPTFR